MTKTKEDEITELKEIIKDQEREIADLKKELMEKDAK